MILLFYDSVKSVRSPPPQEQGEAEAKYDELTATPIPHSPLLLRV